MPRQTRKQSSIRTGAGESNVNRPVDPVTTYAPYVSYANIRADSSIGASEMRIAEAAKGFGRSLQQLAVSQHETDIKKRRLAGQADALAEGSLDEWAAKKDAILADPDKGAEYFTAFSVQGARVAAATKSNDLIDDFKTRTDLNTVAKMEAWFAGEIKTDMDTITGLGEDETTIAYAAKIEETEIALRAKAADRHNVAVYQETETNFNMVVQNELDTVLQGTPTASSILEVLEQQNVNGRAVLLEAGDINEAQVRAVGEFAMAEGKPELLNIFEYSRTDVNDPDKTVPGLAFTTQHGASIEDYRKKATKEFDAKVADNLKDTQYAAEKHMGDLVRDGKSAEAEVFADLMQEERVFTSAVAASWYQKAHAVSKKENRVARDLVSITNGDTVSINPKHRKDAVEAYGDRQLERAGMLGSPEAIHEATKDIVATGGQAGVLYPRFKGQLAKLNLMDPEQFAATMELADVVKGTASSLYIDEVPVATRQKIAQANRWAEAGIGQDQIMVGLQELETPEAIARTKELRADKKAMTKLRSSVRDNVATDDGGWFGLSSELTNSDEVVEWITENAVDYATRFNADLSDADEWAREQYEASFVTIDLPNGDKQSIYKGQLGLPTHINEQMQWFSEEFTSEMDPEGNGDVGYYLKPDPASRHSDEREFLVVDSTGRTQTEMRDGLAVPMRVGQRELESKWQEGLFRGAEDAQAEQQSERTRRNLQYRKYYGQSGDVSRERYKESRTMEIEGLPEREQSSIFVTEDGQVAEPQSNLGSPSLDTAFDVVKKFEGFRDTAYYATDAEKAKGLLTNGYGRTTGVTDGQKTTKAEEEAWLGNQLQATATALDSEIGPAWDKLTDNQQAAVVSLAYNVDKDVVGQFKRSKAMAALKRGDLETFQKEAFDAEIGFTKQDGKTLAGLVKRRKQERELFNS